MQQSPERKSKTLVYFQWCLVCLKVKPNRTPLPICHTTVLFLLLLFSCFSYKIVHSHTRGFPREKRDSLTNVDDQGGMVAMGKLQAKLVTRLLIIIIKVFLKRKETILSECARARTHTHTHTLRMWLVCMK